LPVDFLELGPNWRELVSNHREISAIRRNITAEGIRARSYTRTLNLRRAANSKLPINGVQTKSKRVAVAGISIFSSLNVLYPLLSTGVGISHPVAGDRRKEAPASSTAGWPFNRASRYKRLLADCSIINPYTGGDGAFDQDRVSFPRYVNGGLLPLVINGKRLSDSYPVANSYPVAKFGGAITMVGATVVIVDRLGSFYSYDLKTSSFQKLSLPTLPNNLEVYLRRRSHLDGVENRNLAGSEAQMEFRAHDITFLPDRKEVAVLYDQFDDALGKLRTVVSVLPIDGGNLMSTGDWQMKFTSETFDPGNAAFSGGRMAYRGQDKLYLSVGDHAIYDPRVSQESNTAFGKIIELDLSSKQWRTVSKGHRNVEGLIFTKSGQLIATENGPRGGDALDAITDGDNYGWPIVSLGTAYGSYDFTGGSFAGGDIRSRYTDPSLIGRITGYTAPMFAWVPSIAPSQLVQIDNLDPRWNGDLVVGSMKGESLFRIRLEAGRVLYSEPIWIGQRIRDLTQTGDGRIVLWTDDSQLIFVSVDTDKLAQKRLGSAFLGEVEAGGCLGCHHFGPTNPTDSAPTLSNLFNKPIASDAFRYSPGLRAQQGVWTEALLEQFLTDPTKFASGTVMPSMRMLGLDRDQIEDIIETLVRASSQPSGG
jgi:aldose sugar dehydrogenase